MKIVRPLKRNHEKSFQHPPQARYIETFEHDVETLPRSEPNAVWTWDPKAMKEKKTKQSVAKWKIPAFSFH